MLWLSAIQGEVIWARTPAASTLTVRLVLELTRMSEMVCIPRHCSSSRTASMVQQTELIARRDRSLISILGDVNAREIRDLIVPTLEIIPYIWLDCSLPKLIMVLIASTIWLSLTELSRTPMTVFSSQLMINSMNWLKASSRLLILFFISTNGPLGVYWHLWAQSFSLSTIWRTVFSWSPTISTRPAWGSKQLAVLMFVLEDLNPGSSEVPCIVLDSSARGSE